MAKMNAINPKRPTLKAGAPPRKPEINPNSDLLLIDWNGVPLKGYTLEETLALDSLPIESGVTHELLQFQGWNWELDDIKSWIQNHKGHQLIVGAIYTTTDGGNHNYWKNSQLLNVKAICAQKRGVDSVDSGTFAYCYSLENVNIPDGVTLIGSEAFSRCYSLKYVNLPDGVTAINERAFFNCCSLVNISFPNGVTYIGEYAFWDCYSLVNINFPDEITLIADYAFGECYSLTNIDLPDELGVIGESAFYDCYSLTNISIPKGISLIGKQAFFGCRELYDVVIHGRPRLQSNDVFIYGASTQKYYVHRSDLGWYETATNWSALYSQGKVVAAADHLDYLRNVGIDVTDFEDE